MILDWVAQAPSFAFAVLAFYGPGLLIAAAGRLRGLALWAFAPVASVAVAGTLAILYPILGIRWDAVSFAAGAAVIVLAAVGVARWAFPSRPARGEGSPLLLILALAAGGLLIALRLGFYVGVPEAISQTNDAVFHLNALRFIQETGSASSLTITGVLGSSSFYPAGWHAIVSIIVDLNGGDIPVAANMASMVIAALAWPAGLAWFALVVFRDRAIAAVTAAMSGAMMHFPMLMLEWGVLYPNALALSLLPASLALVWNGIDAAAEADARWKHAVRLAVFVLLILAGLGLAQPVVVLTWVLVVGVRVTGSIAGAHLSLALRVVSIAATEGLVIVLWLVMARVSGGAHWAPYANWVEAVAELALTSQVDLPLSPLMTLLAVGGAMIAWRRGRSARDVVVVWAGLAVLMIVATSVANPVIRRWLLGPWYADPYRIAATLPLAMVPLAAVGLLWCVRALLGSWKDHAPARNREARVGVLTAVAAGAAALVFWPVLMMPLAPDHEIDEQSRYASTRSSFLSPDERALLSRLDTLVEPGARIIGNPSTGIGFGYALSGADVFPKNWSHPRGDAWKVIGEHLSDAAQRPAVCESLAQFGDPHYVLDFGPGERTAGRFVLRGMTGFESTEGFELVAREGDAALWRIAAC